MFLENNIPVYYSKELHVSDLIASFAQADNADILSWESNFFNYTDRKFAIYENFFIDSQKNQIHLVESRFQNPREGSKMK